MSELHDEDRQQPPEGREPQPGREAEAEEPQHPGWLTLAQVFNSADPFFENFLFLLAYDYSSNIYVIKGDYLTIVDPGNDYTGFMDLFKLGYRAEDIKKIVLTHGIGTIPWAPSSCCGPIRRSPRAAALS